MTAFQRAAVKIVERHGKGGLLLLLRTVRNLSAPTDDNAVREALRNIGIWFSDEDYLEMVSKSQKDNSFDVDLFIKQLISGLHSRRSNVLQVLWERLDRSRCGFVELNDFLSAYDVSRHPDVISGRRCAQDVAQEFYDIFSENTSGVVTKEEMLALYSAISLRIERHEEFELLVARSFALDRPSRANETAAPKGYSPAATSQGRSHPLYQTSASLVGTDCDKVHDVHKKHNRMGNFTKHAPPFTGSTVLNTSTTRPRV